MFTLRIIGRIIYNYSTIFPQDVIASSGCKASLPLWGSPAAKRGFPFFDDRMLAMGGRTVLFHAWLGPIHPTP
jgi:hypothetical protein